MQSIRRAVRIGTGVKSDGKGLVADQAGFTGGAALSAADARLRTKAKWANIVAALTMACVAFEHLLTGQGQGADHCNPLLLRTVMGWLGVLGTLVLGAELGLSAVLRNIQVLQHRSGRAFLLLMCGTIGMAAAPVELPMAATGYAYTEGAFVVSMQYSFLIAGALCLLAAGYSINASLSLSLPRLAAKVHGHIKPADEAALLEEGARQQPAAAAAQAGAPGPADGESPAAAATEDSPVTQRGAEMQQASV